MQKTVRTLLVFAAFVVLVSSCNGSGGNAVALTDAKGAWFAAFGAANSAPTVCTVDNGSTADHERKISPDGTVLYEKWPIGSYPVNYVYTAVAAQTGGYTVTGSIASTYTSENPNNGTVTLNFNLSNPSNPVKTMVGTLTIVNGGVTGSLSFDGTFYTYAQLNY